jgi:hypothetical protein
MALDDFRAVFLPYCLEKRNGGRYVVLNREYKPVGIAVESGEWVNQHNSASAWEVLGFKSFRACR